MKRQSLMLLTTVVCATAVVLAANNQKCVRYPSNETTGGDNPGIPCEETPVCAEYVCKLYEYRGQNVPCGVCQPHPNFSCTPRTPWQVQQWARDGKCLVVGVSPENQCRCIADVGSTFYYVTNMTCNCR